MRRARALLALLLASLLLAGCTKPPPEAPAAEVSPADEPAPAGTAGVVHPPKDGPTPSTSPSAPADPALPGASQPPPMPSPSAQGGLYHVGRRSTEPTLGVDAAGNVYINAFAPGGPTKGGETIMRSADKGRTWEDVGPRLPTGGSPAFSSFDPYLHVDPATGRVFMDNIWPLGCGQTSFSDDGGASWVTNPASCGNPHVNDHQTLATGKPRTSLTVGYPNVVYRCVNNVAYPACAMSHNGGLTFSPQVPVVPVEFVRECGAQTGHVTSDPEGRVFLPNGGCNQGPMVAVSEDDGLTWSAYRIDPDTPLDDFGHDVDVASDEAGNLYAVWTHGGQVHLSRSVDHGKTWTKARNVTAPGVTATMFAAVAAAGPGKIAFAYVGSTIPGGYEGKTAGVGGLGGDIMGEPDLPEWANATWNAYIGVVTDALDDGFTIETVAANDPLDPLARGMCGGTRCHGMNDFLDIVIDAEGRPWAAFVDVCVKACVSDPEVHWDENEGAVGTLVEGPSLLAAGGRLAPLAPPVAPKP